MHRNYWLRRLMLGLAASLCLAAPLRAQEPYLLHTIIPLTGGGAFLGKSVQMAMQAAEQVINREGGVRGRQVRFVFHDDQSSPQIAVQLSNEVLATHPQVIFGSALSAMCNAMAPLMQNGPVMYCLSPAIHPKPGSFVFTASVSQDDYFVALVRFARQQGWKRIALLTTTDASGQDADRGMRVAMERPENRAIDLVAQEHFTPGDVTISAQVERIRAAKPDFLIGWATGASAGGMFRGLSQTGFDIPVAASTSSMTYAQIAAFAAFLPKQLYYASTIWPAYGDARVPISPAVQKQLDPYFETAAAAGWKPDTASETGWDPPRIVVHALNQVGTDAMPTQLRDAMLAITDYVGVDGKYNYVQTPQRGLAAQNTMVSRWDPAVNKWIPVNGPGGVALKPAP